MIIALIIIGIITLFWVYLLLYIDNNHKKVTFGNGVFFGLVLSTLVIIDIALLSAILEDPKPTSMDVYQGKTTLEYKVVDSVKVDSVVVFKESYYGKEN